jgi:hypothetical protein
MAFLLDKQTPPASVIEQPFAETACCIQSRLHPECVRNMHGEKLLAPESGPLPWERWWWDDSHRPSFGWTAGNFATQIAVWMGCNPIIWVGMDLCYREGQKYSDRQNSAEVPLIEYGQRMTQRDWLMAARWSEELSRGHPHIRFVNTSMEGLPLSQPISTIPLADIAASLNREFDLQGRLHRILQQEGKLSLMTEQKETEWQASWERCRSLCSRTDGDVDHLLSEEAVFEYYLEPLWHIWRPLFIREARGDNIEWHRILFFHQVLQNGST